MAHCITQAARYHYLVLEHPPLLLALGLLHAHVVDRHFLLLDLARSLLPLLLLLGLPNDSLALSVVDVYGRAKRKGANGLMRTGLCVWGCDSLRKSR